MKQKLLTWWKAFTYPFVNTFGLLRSLWHFKGKPIRSKTFYGFFHFELAKKYAHKRFNWYPAKWNQLGKPQGVFVSGDESLIVISPNEVKFLKKKYSDISPKWYKKIFNSENLYKIN